VTVGVVGGQGLKIVQGWGYSPAKQKTECIASIGLVLKPSAGAGVGGIAVAVGVVGGQGPKILQGWGYSPVKPKTKCNTLRIDLVPKLLVEAVVGMCRVGWMWQLQWWEARGRRLCRTRGIRLRNRIPSATHTVLIWCSNHWWGEWWGYVG
jgi:hypothetical protein